MSELHRFSRQLVESLSSHEPGALGAPVALDDITSRVLPYRACRRLFGILNVEDYELLLLRLVAGEAGLAAAAPPTAVERCQAELDTGHPDPGLLRELEDVTLRLNLGAIALGHVGPEHADAAIARSYTLYEPEAEPEVDTVAALPESTADEVVEFDYVDTPARVPEDGLPAPDSHAHDPEPDLEADPFQALFDASGDASEPEPEGPEPPQSTITAPLEPVAPPPLATHGEPPPRCPHCASRLPSGRPVRFCPHCGSNVVPLQCINCGAGLEPAWRHCVLCGAPAVNDSRFA